MSEDFRREVRVDPQGGDTRIIWLLHGKRGTIQFVLRITKRQPDPRWPSLTDYEMHPWDVGYHWRTRRYSEEPTFDKCDYLDGAACWYDGSGLQASELWERVMASEDRQADHLIWTELEEWYGSCVDDDLADLREAESV